MYYWIISTDSKGKRSLIGPYNSEYSAQRKADNLEQDYDIVSLPTRNSSSASRMVKAKAFEDSGDFDKSTQKLKHPKKKEEED